MHGVLQPAKGAGFWMTGIGGASRDKGKSKSNSKSNDKNRNKSNGKNKNKNNSKSNCGGQECPPYTRRFILLAGGARLRGRGSIWNSCGLGLGGCRVGGWWRLGGGCTRRRRGLRRRR